MQSPITPNFQKKTISSHEKTASESPIILRSPPVKESPGIPSGSKK